jgi:hypothetical protein
MRGHVGDCAGTDAILASLSGSAVVKNRAPVFGCALFNGPDLQIGKDPGR